MLKVVPPCPLQYPSGALLNHFMHSPNSLYIFQPGNHLPMPLTRPNRTFLQSPTLGPSPVSFPCLPQPGRGFPPPNFLSVFFMWHMAHVCFIFFLFLHMRQSFHMELETPLGQKLPPDSPLSSSFPSFYWGIIDK